MVVCVEYTTFLLYLSVEETTCTPQHSIHTPNAMSNFFSALGGAFAAMSGAEAAKRSRMAQTWQQLLELKVAIMDIFPEHASVVMTKFGWLETAYMADPDGTLRKICGYVLGHVTSEDVKDLNTLTRRIIAPLMKQYCPAISLPEIDGLDAAARHKLEARVVCVWRGLNAFEAHQ